MTYTTTVFILTIGTAVLTAVTMYLYFHYQTANLKKKIASLNQALTNLQSERSTLLMKVDNLYMENVTHTKEMEKLLDNLLSHQQTIERFEADNSLLVKEYLELENQLKKIKE